MPPNPAPASDTAKSAVEVSATGACLTEDEVLDFAGGAMAPDARQHAEAHLGKCSECRRLVSEAVLALAPDTQAVSAPAGASPAPLPEIGDVVEGKYEIEHVVGQGGMGVVFAARHLMLDHLVALKFLWSPTELSPKSKERFLREGRAALRIESDHITRVMDVGITEHGAPFVVMELLQGSDIRSILASNGPMPWRKAVPIILQALEAVGAAHDAGVVHRDLKPANLFLVRTRQEEPRVKVLDFGVSKVDSDPSSNTLTTTQAMLGSPAYMAPEQMEDASKVDARADVWSVGATMYEMLMGKPPFDGPTVTALHRAILDSKGVSTRDHVPDVPKSIDAVIRRCLSVDPANRYQDGKALRTALENAQLGRQTVANVKLAALSPRWLWLVVALVAAVALVLLVRHRGQGRAADVGASPAASDLVPTILPSSEPALLEAPPAASSVVPPPPALQSSTRPPAIPTTTPVPVVKRPREAPPQTTASSKPPSPSSTLTPDPHAPGLSDRE